MKTLIAKVRRRILGLSPDEVRYKKRGFRGATPAMSDRLENVGSAFLAGYHHALESVSIAGLELKLNEIDLELRGFAYEGAAMGLALLDRLKPWPGHRISSFLAGPGGRHAYMVHVGVGWVWARVPWGFRKTKAKLDPLLGWLALDGWGFHEGFFQWPNYISAQPAPARLSGYERRAFDQGLGRSFWFVNGGNPDLIAQVMANFPPERQADLWSGLGLAASYAGIVSAEELQHLRERAGAYRAQLAQGAAFAAKARQRAGNPTGHTRLAAKILCEMSADEAAGVTDEALEGLAPEAEGPAYEIWRQRIHSRFQNHFSVQKRGIAASVAA